MTNNVSQNLMIRGWGGRWGWRVAGWWVAGWWQWEGIKLHFSLVVLKFWFPVFSVSFVIAGLLPQCTQTLLLH